MTETKICYPLVCSSNAHHGGACGRLKQGVNSCFQISRTGAQPHIFDIATQGVGSQAAASQPAVTLSPQHSDDKCGVPKSLRS